MSSTIQVRVDDELKNKVDKLFKDLGTDTTSAIRMFLTQAVATNGFPFEIKRIPDNPYAALTEDNKVCELAKELRPSQRGELEITDLNSLYLGRGELSVEILGRGFAWLDTGTHDSMLQASVFVQTMELNKGVKIACLEEIAYNQGFVSRDDLLRKIEKYGMNNEYYNYVRNIVNQPKQDLVGV